MRVFDKMLENLQDREFVNAAAKRLYEKGEPKLPNAEEYVNNTPELTRKQRRKLAKALDVEFKPKYNGEPPKDFQTYVIDSIVKKGGK